MEVFTRVFNFFKFGGIYDLVKTEIDEYERIRLGKGIYGILFYNPIKGIWHLAEEQSGALVGTHQDKGVLISQVRIDVDIGDEKIMQRQIEEGKRQLSQAKLVTNKDFFEKFQR